MSFTGNPKNSRYAIIGLIAATLTFAYCSRAKGAEPDPIFFVGMGHAYQSTTPLATGMRLGMEQGHWQASIVTHGETIIHRSEASYLTEPNLGTCGTWHVFRRRWSVGWGACLWEHGDWSVGDAGPVGYDAEQNLLTLDDDGMQLTAAIVLRRTFGKRELVYVEAFHASNGGSSHYNRGRNLIAGGFRF